MTRPRTRVGMALLAFLTACPGNITLSNILDGSSQASTCICPGLPGRYSGRCPVFPFNGNIVARVHCTEERANLTTPSNQKRCVGVVFTDNPNASIGPQNLIDIPADNQVYDAEFETVGTNVGTAGANGSVYISYSLNGVTEDIYLGRLRVSNNCPF